MAKRKSTGDMGVPDSAGSKDGGQEHIRFDDSYINAAMFKHPEIKPQSTSEENNALRLIDQGCEYSTPLEHLALLRACVLSKSNCGILGWRDRFKDCDLFKAAKREKEKEKKVDNTTTL